MTEFKTKKAARESNYRTYDEWLRRDFLPTEGAESITVKGDDFYHESLCEPLLTKKALKEMGLKVPEEAEPAKWKYYQNMSTHHPIYRQSDGVPVKKRKEIPPEKIDLLLAIFVVNKAAKRSRDASQSLYLSAKKCFSRNDRRKKNSLHNLSRVQKFQKENLYELKEKGIMHAYEKGLITPVGNHGGFLLYRGDGFSFHSRIAPENISIEPIRDGADEETFMIPATVKEKGEPRLKDAVFTLEELPDIEEGFYIFREPFKPDCGNHEDETTRYEYETSDEESKDSEDEDEWGDDGEWYEDEEEFWQ